MINDPAAVAELEAAAFVVVDARAAHRQLIQDLLTRRKNGGAPSTKEEYRRLAQLAGDAVPPGGSYHRRPMFELLPQPEPLTDAAAWPDPFPDDDLDDPED